MKTKVYYKVLSSAMRSTIDINTKWFNGRHTVISATRPLEFGKYGLHVFKSLDMLSLGKFGPNVFEVELIGETKENKHMAIAYNVKLLREVNPKDIMDSEWLYFYLNLNRGDMSFAKNIKDSAWAYYFCRYIEDLPEVRKNITSSEMAYEYCKHINPHSNLKHNITHEQYAYLYCMNVDDNKLVRKHIHNKEKLLTLKNKK